MGSALSSVFKSDTSVHTGGSSVRFSPPTTSCSSRHETSGSSGTVSCKLKVFSFNELKAATRNFRPDNVLGEGRFGLVYKGWIDENTHTAAKPGTGMVVAVKELNQGGFLGHREWMAEVVFLGQLSHPNLVKLIGYCLEDDHRFLVYEYMSRGSLENHLFRWASSLQLSWNLRMKVALDAAKGLAFLHSDMAKVIYTHFKSSNILLDMDCNAKLSNFGLAKDEITGSKSHVSTRIMGTDGYAAPEYIATGYLTAKSDVYSFGVVLLEIISGRRAIDKLRPFREQNLVEWARPYLGNRRKISRVLDARIEGQYLMRDVIKVANLTVQCLSTEPTKRPSMQEVVKTLEQLNSNVNKQSKCIHKETGQKFDHVSIGPPGHCRDIDTIIANTLASYPLPSASPLKICETGKHMTEKPVIEKATSTSKNPMPLPTLISRDNSSKEVCSRCKEGFLCLDHRIPAQTRMVLDNVVDNYFSALFIQKIFRGWKCRKDFSEIRLKMIKLQLQHKGVGSRGLQIETESFGLTETKNICKVHLEKDMDVPRNVSIKREPHGIESNQKLVDHYAYPSRSLPLSLHAENLVEMSLSCCNYPQLWTGKQAVVSLKLLDLSNSKVTQMPDVSEAYKLRNLILEGCIYLIHMSSIKSLTNLENLNLKGCTSLKRLPSLMGLKSLCTLNLSDCYNLRRLPLSIGSLSGLFVLNIRNCKRLQNLPISTLMMNSLQVLNISGCLELLKDFNRTEMETLPPSMIPHSSLSPLSLSDDNNRGSLGSVDTPHMLYHDELASSNGEVGIQLFTQTESLSLNQLDDNHRRHSQSSDESATDLNSGLSQQRKELDEYVNMLVEAPYEAEALQDVARIAEELVHQSSGISEKTNLEDIICLLDQLDDTYHETTLSVKTTRARKTSLQLNLSGLDMRLVQEAEEFITLESKLDTLSQEEAELEAEIQRLIVLKEELLGRKDLVAIC